MPTHKDLKRLVRGRMKKTGESYTAARAQLLKSPRPQTKQAFDGVPGSTTPAHYPKLAGMTDAAIKAGTGCAWKKWVDALDYVGAHQWPHGKIATYVHEKLSVRDWWSQSVTVGYERIRGLRDIGQRRDGSYEATKSRTFAAAVERVYAAFAESRKRARWLPSVKPTMRKATAKKSVRMTWEDGTSVEVLFYPKGAGKSSAHIQHRKLPDKDAVARVKSFWTERLETLGKMLAD